MATITVANHSKEKQRSNPKPRRSKIKTFNEATTDFFKKSNLKPSTHAQ